MIIIKNVEDFEAERERQFKAWIKAGKEEDEFFLNLEGADLHGASLNGADLKNVNLTNANLKGADLEGSNLMWADFCGADLSSLYIISDGILSVKNTNLKNCNFLFTNFTNATLCNCDLRWVNKLSSAHLMYSFKTGAIITPLQETSLSIIYGVRGAKFMKGFIVKEME